MSYFKDFSDVFYKFGDQQSTELFQNITLYVDIIDQIKDNYAFYESYYIQENERPDQLSMRLYDTPEYHWTFYMMNDTIRERGWPLSNPDIIEKCQKDYPHLVLTTRNSLNGVFKIGARVYGKKSGANGYISHRSLDLGQIHLENVTGTFTPGEILNCVNELNLTDTVTLISAADEYLSAHHYEDANGNHVDIDPYVGPGALLTEVTYLDRHIALNNQLKSIRVIKNAAIADVIAAYQEALRS